MVYLTSNSPSKCRLYSIVHSVIGSYKTLSINIGLVESYSSIKYTLQHRISMYLYRTSHRLQNDFKAGTTHCLILASSGLIGQ
jgi:hypothetical protein